MVDPTRKTPIATILFVGPTGVGKTEIVRALYRILFGNDLIDIGTNKYDCTNYSASHSISNVIGASPEFVGREQTPLLADKLIFAAFNKARKEGTLHEILKDYEDFAILLLDEIEKAHSAFHDIFLSIMDEGSIELNNGLDEGQEIKYEKNSKGGNNKIDYHKVTNFRNVLIIMTSNIGAQDIQQKLDGKGTMGFMQEDNSADKLLSVDYYTQMVKNSGIFKPEFVGRITALIPFKPLTKEEFYQRLDLSVRNHNKVFKDKGVSLSLTSRVKKHLVDMSHATNEGGRSLIKMFEHDIYTKFVRLYNNGELDRVEEESGHPVKVIEIDYQNDDYITHTLVNDDKKALRKEQKREALIKAKRKKIDQQEAIISLKENSFLITLRDTLLPNLKYYRVLLKYKDSLDENYVEELEKTKDILDMFGLQDKDFELLKSESIESKYQEYSNMFEELSLESSGITLWNDDNKSKSFSGMLRYIEKYIRKYFTENEDLKAMIKGGAGTLVDGISPIIEYTEKLLSRDISYEEEGILIAIFHREYLKLNSNVPIQKQIPHKKTKDDNVGGEKNPGENKTKAKKKEELKNITVNINFYGNNNETSLDEKMRNLFQEDFEYVMLAIRQNIANKKETDDILDVMIAIKVDLEKRFTLSSSQTSSINKLVQELLKKEEFDKDDK